MPWFRVSKFQHPPGHQVKAKAKARRRQGGESDDGNIWMFPKMVGFPPKSSIFIGFSINYKIHPFWGTSIFGNTHMEIHCLDAKLRIIRLKKT